MIISRSIILLLFVFATKPAYCQQDNISEAEQHKPAEPALKFTAVDSSVNKYSDTLSKKAQAALAKKDSLLQSLQAIPEKYFTAIDKKVEKYSGRITKKTEKTLEKLSKWETKIKTSLEKVSPETASKLFGNNQLTFAGMLQKLKDGENIAKRYHQQYDGYRDKLATSLKYMDEQKSLLDDKLIKPLEKTRAGMDSLSVTVNNAEAVQQFIKERKKKLVEGAFSMLGKNKYLSKINKETWYYTETIKNYKTLFSDEEKTEQTVKSVLNNIPAFKEFLGKNSGLAGIFTSSNSSGLQSRSSMPVVNGLPSRGVLQSYLQENIPSLNVNGSQGQLKMPAIKEELNKWVKKLNDKGGMSNNDIPDFKPNTQRSKLFKQRLEFGYDLQFKNSNNLFPAAANFAAKIGYRLNDKQSVGIGASYSLGLGSGWDKIKFSHEGVGIRSYLKWKIKKAFDIQGGAECNQIYISNMPGLPIKSEWQQSALLGISKPYPVSKKRKGNIQVLYDFLYKSHFPVSQPILFRFGYDLK